MANCDCTIRVGNRDTVPDPVRVRAGDTVVWTTDSGDAFAIERIELAPPVGCGAPAQPFDPPGPPYNGPAGGTARSGTAKRAAIGHQYKSIIRVMQASQPPITIDPHIIIDP